MIATLRHGSDGVDRLWLWCPGCEDLHCVTVDGPSGWTWDGNTDAPTISPSIKVGGVQWAPEYGFHKPTHTVAPGERITCHSFVRAGVWEFLSDSTHHLAGQSAPVAPIPAGLFEEEP